MPVDYFVCLLPVGVVVLLLAGIAAITSGRKRGGWMSLAGAAALAVSFVLIYLLPGWILMAKASAGNVDAQYRLGRWYGDRLGYNFPDNAEAFTWFSLAAENGHAAAQAWMGLQYMYGSPAGPTEIPEDADEAAAWFIKAAMNRTAATAHDLSMLGDPLDNLRKLNGEGRITLAGLLRTAASAGDAAAAAVLLDAGAGIDALGAYGRTPLMLAGLRGDVQTVRLLIERGADASATDDRGRDAAELADEAGHSEVAEILRTTIESP